MNSSVKQHQNSQDSKPKKKSTAVVVNIDLPGQPIQCWTTDVEKLTVILRKHRDIVFDIDMSLGKTYTVRSELSEMYDTRTKKLVHPGEAVNFTDAEILHLWIGRDFKGKILLFEGVNLIGAYPVAKLDPEIANMDPVFKPAPINVIMKTERILNSRRAFEVIQPDGSYSIPPMLSVHENEKFLQVVEIDQKKSDVPREIADFFKHGGEKEIMPSGGVATHNWIMNQVAAQSGYISDNKDWMKELYKQKITLKAMDHAGGRKMYVILTGSTSARRNLSAARYASTNTKVLAFSFGAGSAAGLRHASWGAVKGNFSGAGRLAMLFTMTLDIAEWLGDFEQRDPITGKPKQDISDLFIKLGIDVAKNLINSAITSYVAGLSLMLLAGAPIVVIIVGTMLISVAVGFGMDLLDKRYGVSEKIASALKNTPSKLENSMPKDYGGFKEAVEQAVKYGGFSE